MNGLIDADIIQYEASFAAESFWKHLHKERGEEVTHPPPFEIVEENILGRLAHIKEEANVDDLFLFFTGKGNFRHFIAASAPYKDRPSERPYHYKNVKAYLQSLYPWVQKDGLEADDLIGIAMSNHPGAYCCITRDKDLRSIPGYHYGWELGNQPAFGPMLIDQLGFITLSANRKKVVGGGGLFFYYQVLTGDPVDTIPGLPKMGPVTAFELLHDALTLEDAEKRVVAAYSKVYGEEQAEARMLETGRLVNMTREQRNNYEEILLWNPLYSGKREWMNVATGKVSIE